MEHSLNSTVESGNGGLDRGIPPENGGDHAPPDEFFLYPTSTNELMDIPNIQYMLSLDSLNCSFSTSSWSYDVFLSFRGKDTRGNFTEHLYTALVEAGIHTFRDDHELPKGNKILVELLKAIKESRISIVVFSEDYASSKWCLDELVEILECMKSKRQLVFPVFYHVDPADVRRQTGSFAAAFARHKEHFHTEKVDQWRAALTRIASLSVWVLQNDASSRSEPEFIENIVKKVLQKATRKLFVAKHLVGMDIRVKNLMSLLRFGPDGVSVVGIYGMGGIGKTTMAKEFYNSNIEHYEDSCFLANVREESIQFNGLVHLQERLLYEITGKNHKVANGDVGINLIKERLGHRRVLIVLDDLDQLSQLDFLAGSPSWFGNGSLIIVTTRNKHLLDQTRVDVKYLVKKLNHEDSLLLFSLHAFESSVPLQNYRELLRGIINYAGRLPLAIEILASSLVKKSMEEWKSMLEKLKRFPQARIQEKLRISFDSLDDTEKDIFLDVACFFIGMEKEQATKIFDGCGFFGKIGISTLMDRCLLKTDWENRLRMHDLVRDMGREVVREKFPKEPRKRSRLWQQDDVCNVLSNNKGSEEIEGMLLDVPMQMHFITRPFAKMPNLRLLQINNVNLVGSFRGLFKELRWLCWHECPLEQLPADLRPEKLVSLDMQKSNLHIFSHGTKFLGNLKILNLGESEYLVTTPVFTEVPYLEELRLDYCLRLSNIDGSIGVLDKLITLSIQGCDNLKSLPNSICQLRSLQELDIVGCSRLKLLPKQLGNLKGLRSLRASQSGIKQFPDSIGHLDRLIELDLEECGNLERLPNSICNLRLLQGLELYGCSNLERLPQKLGDMKGLKYIDVTGTLIEELPDSLGSLGELTHLKLNKCFRLKSLPPTICSLRSLKYLDLYWCCKLEGTGRLHNYNNLKSVFSGLFYLVNLNLSHCNLFDGDIPDDLWKLTSMKTLGLSGTRICHLPSALGQLSSLEELRLIDCMSLQTILELPPNLQRLMAHGCSSLEKVPTFSNLKHLKELDLSGCSRLVEIQGLENLHSAYEIHLEGCCTLSTTTLQNVLLQGYSGNLCDCTYYLSKQESPDWFEYQGTKGSSVSFDVLLDVKHDFLHLTLWVDYALGNRINNSFHMWINNISRGTQRAYFIHGISFEEGLCMIHGPKGYLVEGGDIIEVSAKFPIESSDTKVNFGVHIAQLEEDRHVEIFKKDDKYDIFWNPSWTMAT